MATLKIILMDHELRKRLRRLGVSRGVRSLKHKKPATSSRPDQPQVMPNSDDKRVQKLEHLFPNGRLEQTGEGACFIVDRVYPLTYEHGYQSLQLLLDYAPDAAAVYNNDPRLAHLAFRDFLFLDTETTGLGGAGTIAFMIGAAFVERASTNDVLIVRQYFLRDHADERAMLLLFDELVEQKVGLITFNGRAFDLPLLSNRYLMNRLPTRLLEVPHIDLLPPSRRLWRNRIGSVALGNLEKELLGVQRTTADIPGWLIPTVYTDYLRSGDATEIVRVFYHNQLDMLSMVTLAGEIMRLFCHASADDDPTDLLSLGKWQADLGLSTEAETHLRLAASGELQLPHYHQALKNLGRLLKRGDRRHEAVPIWQQWAATSLDDVEAHVELAMHFEWQERDLAKAKMWTEQALGLVSRWPRSSAAVARPPLEHRLKRLQRKLKANQV